MSKDINKLSPIAICDKCRNVYFGKGLTLSTPCPECGEEIGRFTLSPDCIISAYEDQDALRTIIEFSECETVAKISDIMGFEGPDSCSCRESNKVRTALNQWRSRMGARNV